MHRYTPASSISDGPITNLASITCILVEVVLHARANGEKAVIISSLALLLVNFQVWHGKHSSERVNQKHSSPAFLVCIGGHVNCDDSIRHHCCKVQQQAIQCFNYHTAAESVIINTLVAVDQPCAATPQRQKDSRLDLVGGVPSDSRPSTSVFLVEKTSSRDGTCSRHSTREIGWQLKRMVEGWTYTCMIKTNQVIRDIWGWLKNENADLDVNSTTDEEERCPCGQTEWHQVA